MAYSNLHWHVGEDDVLRIGGLDDGDREGRLEARFVEAGKRLSGIRWLELGGRQDSVGGHTQNRYNKYDLVKECIIFSYHIYYVKK